MVKKVLVFTPHPDDAEYYAGGTIAKMIQQGASVTYIIATDGRRGSFHMQSGALAPIRAEEARKAAEILGAEPPVLLSHIDYELDHLPPGKLREQFCRLIRQHRPDAVISEDPFSSFEVHPDHRAVAWAASDAVHYASLPLVNPEHMAMGLEPHFVVEKYFYTEALGTANLIVDITDTIDLKINALAEHKSQMTFLAESLTRQANLVGLDLQAILGEAASSPENLLAWALRNRAAEVGQRKGIKFGEAFRVERLNPQIEKLVASQASIKPA